MEKYLGLVSTKIGTHSKNNDKKNTKVNAAKRKASSVNRIENHFTKKAKISVQTETLNDSAKFVEVNAQQDDVNDLSKERQPQVSV